MVSLGWGRLPGPLLGCLALRLLRGQNRLALRFGLARNLGEPFRLGLARGFRGLRGFAGCDLRLFLGAALGFFGLFAPLFG